MKIAILDLVFHWPPQGGSWVDVRGTACALAARGHAVRILAPRFTDYFPRGVIRTDPGVPVEAIPFSRGEFNAIDLPRRFRQRVDAFAPDVVLVTDGYFLKPHLVGAVAADYPVAVRFYAYELFCWRNTLFTPLTDDNCATDALSDPARCRACCPQFSPLRVAKRLLAGENLHFQHEYYAAGAFLPNYPRTVAAALRAARHLIVYNRFIADLVRPHNPAVSIIPTGIELPADPAPDPRPGAGRFTIFFPGRTGDPVKGFAVLRDAVRLLRARGLEPLVRYTCENRTDPDPDPDFTNLGWLDGPGLAAEYRRCDAVVSCSFWREAFGITVIEAMAHGVPVIASRIGGMAETIADGVDGLQVAPRDPAALAEALARLAADPGLRRRLGAAGRETARTRYAWPVVVAATESALQAARDPTG